MALMIILTAVSRMTPVCRTTTETTEQYCNAEGQYCNHDSDCCDYWCHENKCQCCGTSPWYSTTAPPPPSTTTELYTTCSYDYCTHDSGCCDGGICSDNYCTYPTSPAPTTSGCVESGKYCGYDDNIECCESHDSCLNGYCQQHPTTPPAPSTTAPPPAGCSYLVLTTGADYPDSAITCYDSQGEEVARSADTQVEGTIIISMIYAPTDFRWKVDIHCSSLKFRMRANAGLKRPGKDSPIPQISIIINVKMLEVLK